MLCLPGPIRAPEPDLRVDTTPGRPSGSTAHIAPGARHYPPAPLSAGALTGAPAHPARAVGSHRLAPCAASRLCAGARGLLPRLTGAMLTSSAPRPWRRASQSEERQRIRSRAPPRGAAEREAPARIEPARRRGWLAQGARPARAAARREAWHRWIGGPPLWRVLGPGKKGLQKRPGKRRADPAPAPPACCTGGRIREAPVPPVCSWKIRVSSMPALGPTGTV